MRNALRVGQRLTSVSDFDRLPTGSVVGQRVGTETFVKLADGTYQSQRTSGVLQVDAFDFDGYHDIKSLGSLEVPLISLLQWQWRFWDNSYHSAEQAGVRTGTVDRAMNALGLTDDLFPLGAGVTVASQRNKGLLPEGSVVVHGVPDKLSNFGMFTLIGSGWKPILGQMTAHTGYPVTVVSGEPALWVTTPGTEAEQAAVKQFKARAWKVGWQVKVTNRWCESYESYMARAGLDESVLRDVTFNGITVGDKVNARQSADLPVGSVLRWVSSHDPEVFSWFVRDEESRVVARTRAMFGRRKDGMALRNAASSMEVMWIADGAPMHLPLDYNDMTQVNDLLPPGTRFDGYDGQKFIVAADRKVSIAGRRVPSEGSWALTAVGAPVTVTEFGS